MLFSEFVSVLETLKEFQDLLESDTVEWDPTVGAEHIGKGVTTSVGAPVRAPAVANKKTAKLKDFVFAPDANGKHNVTVITSISDAEVYVINPYQSFKAKYPISALQPAPAGLGSRLVAKNPGSSAWIYNPKLNVPL